MQQPELIEWLVGETDPDIVVEPSGPKKAAGWLKGEKPPNQYFNWFWQLVDLWTKYLRTTTHQYDVVIGAGTDCTHATLEAAVADAGVGTNIAVLLRDNITGGASATSLTKAGWRIYAEPGTTFTKGVATTGISIAAANVEIRGLRFAGFTVGGDKAIALTVAGQYCRIHDCNFAVSTSTEIDDSAVAAGKKPSALGNITEV